jgi:hypothetical protein
VHVEHVRIGESYPAELGQKLVTRLLNVGEEDIVLAVCVREEVSEARTELTRST